MVDLVLSLDAAGHRGKIVALSRRGLIPRSHADFEPAPVERSEVPSGDLRALWRWLRRRGARSRLACRNRQPAPVQSRLVAKPRRRAAAAVPAPRAAMVGRPPPPHRARGRATLAAADRRRPPRDRRRPHHLGAGHGEGLEVEYPPARRRACPDGEASLSPSTAPARCTRSRGPATRCCAACSMSGQFAPDHLGIGLEVDEQLARGRRTYLGARASDQGPLLGDHCGPGYSGAGGGGGRRYRAGAWPMSPMIMAIPKTATWSKSAPACEMPEDVKRGGPHADPLGRRRSRPRRPARHAAPRRARVAGICARLCRGPGRPPQPHLRGGRRLRRDRAAQGHPVPVALRASPGADHRQGVDRLSAERPGRRHQQARARAPRLRAAAAGAGAADRAGRRHDLASICSPRASRW